MVIKVRENLEMRTRTPDNADEVYAVVDSNRAYLRKWLPWVDGTDNVSVIEKVIASWEKEREAGTDYVFGIFKDSLYIGNIGLHDMKKTNKSGMIGYWLAENEQGGGIMTDCVRCLVNYGFDSLFLNRIYIHCADSNARSRAIPERLGFVLEGVLRDGECLYGKYFDLAVYGITKSEWETHKEIAYYNALPFVFDGFIDLPELSDGVIYLVCTAKNPANPEKKRIQEYRFIVCKDGEKIGDIGLRVGYTDGLYYGGQIGYGIDEKHRGNGYAVRACKLLLPVAKAHKMSKLLITNNHTNIASMRVCEKLGARLIRVARLPEWHDLYKEGQRFSNIYEWSVD